MAVRGRGRHSASLQPVPGTLLGMTHTGPPQTGTSTGGGRGPAHAARTRILAAPAMSVFAVVLAVLCMQARTGGPLTVLDGPTTDWMVGHRTALMDLIAVVVTDLASPTVVVAAAVIAAIVLAWQRRSWMVGVVVAASVGGAGAAGELIKTAVARSRPPATVHEVFEVDYSFPSGHVTGTTALVAVLIAVAATGWGRRRRIVAATGGGAAVAIVAASRLYLGVHWLTDVIAGVVVGALFALAGAVALTFDPTNPAATTLNARNQAVPPHRTGPRTPTRGVA